MHHQHAHALYELLMQLSLLNALFACWSMLPVVCCPAVHHPQDGVCYCATGPSLPAPAVAMLYAMSCSVVTAGKRGMVNKSKRRVTFAMSKVQDCPADQENVPS